MRRSRRTARSANEQVESLRRLREAETDLERAVAQDISFRATCWPQAELLGVLVRAMVTGTSPLEENPNPGSDAAEP
ncbi:hypothetical protein V2S66_11670 [Streptomyces sp. V4-01]|uniref:Uncharacterized protein n=1 Tax=Actinacidiphila polyblastidii TaxID=3110430 RepID=A0ABU7PBH5_9ACTN|nr:hypothetical protein [Streptomyces sp. V4-01]